MEELDLEASGLQQRMVEWLQKYGKTLLYGLLIFVVLLILMLKFSTSSKMNAQTSYLEAQSTYNKFTRSESLDPQLLKDLDSHLSTRPDLKSKYDGSICQTLIALREGPLAQPYGERCLERVKTELVQAYRQFAMTTLLISGGKLQEAERNTLALKEELEQAGDATSYLYVSNLVRLAMLQGELGKFPEEQLTWETLASQNQNLDGDSPFARLISSFTDGQVSLLDYMSDRKP